MNDPAKTDRDERLLEQLDADSARLLFPERFPEPLRVTIAHPPLNAGLAEQLGAMLDVATERETPDDGDWTATFTLSEVDALHTVFAVLDESFGAAAVHVRINGQILPMARELWLPLFWSLRS